MKTSTYRSGGVEVIAVQEAVTQAECDELRMQLTEAAAQSRGTVILELTETPFIDSAALEMLLEQSSECIRQGGRLKLAALSANCAEVLRLTDLQSRFEIHGSVEEASKRVL